VSPLLLILLQPLSPRGLLAFSVVVSSESRCLKNNTLLTGLRLFETVLIKVDEFFHDFFLRCFLPSYKIWKIVLQVRLFVVSTRWCRGDIASSSGENHILSRVFNVCRRLLCIFGIIALKT
jgi:hypothetical protein